MMSPGRLLVLAVVFGVTFLAVRLLVSRLEPRVRGRLDGYVQWMLARGEEIYAPLPPDTVRYAILGLPAAGALLGYAIAGAFGLIVLAAAGALVPYGWMRYRIAERRRRLDDQLVDAFVLMGNGLRSGLSLMQALELAAEELKPPVSDEFQRVVKEIRLGQLTDDALGAMSARLQLPDLELAVHSILMLRETGGNLGETFSTVAHTIVERKKVEGRIQALTAQGRYQGLVAGAMPFALAAVFNVMDPEMMEPLFTTPIGWLIWVLVIALDVTGVWLMLKLVKVDV